MIGFLFEQGDLTHKTVRSNTAVNDDNEPVTGDWIRRLGRKVPTGCVRTTEIGFFTSERDIKLDTRKEFRLYLDLLGVDMKGK